MQTNTIQMEQDNKQSYKPVSSVWIGIFLITAGALFAANRLNAGVPNWLVSWPAAIIAGGILLGIYHRFKSFFWFIPVLWGTYALLEIQMPELNLGKYAGAVSIITVGMVFLFRGSRPGNMRRRMFEHVQEDFLDITCILNNVRKEVSIQDFKAADITNILGNTFIDLRTCDIQEPAVIDLTVFMGNAKILIPETWTVQNHASAVFGDVKHKRFNPAAVIREDKVLKFDGTAIFGTISIVSC